MIDTRKVIESIAEIVINISVSFRTHNSELVAKIKRDSLLLEQKIKDSRDEQNVDYIESVRQNLDKLAAAVEQKVTAGIIFTENAVSELYTLFNALIDYTVNVHDYQLTGNKVLEQHIKNEAEKYARFARDAATKHEERLIQGICQSKSSAIYLDMLDGISGIFYNLSRIVG